MSSRHVDFILQTGKSNSQRLNITSITDFIFLMSKSKSNSLRLNTTITKDLNEIDYSYVLLTKVFNLKILFTNYFVLVTCLLFRD